MKHYAKNGVCEIAKKDIMSSLTTKKLNNKTKYDIKISLASAVKAHNKNIYTLTKVNPNINT